MEILMGRGGEKTNPIQSQTNPLSVSPQHCWGIENEFEKTRPILPLLTLGLRFDILCRE